MTITTQPSRHDFVAHLTPDWISAEIAQVREPEGGEDPEVIGSFERSLWRDTLQAIYLQTTDRNAKALARQALRTLDLADGVRWFA